MPFLILSLIVQAVLIAHVVRTGRPQIWIAAIAFLPVAGALAYLALEVLPGYRNQRHVRHLRATAGRRIDPERDLRAARDALALADTAANHERLGDAFAERDRPEEATAAYREAIARGSGHRGLVVKLAHARFEAGDPAETLRLLDSVPSAGGISATDREALLRARALDADGRGDEALPIFADVVTRLPGDEARCHQAAALLRLDRRAEARSVLEEVEIRERRLDRLARAQQAAMYDWARERLSKLRGG